MYQSVMFQHLTRINLNDCHNHHFENSQLFNIKTQKKGTIKFTIYSIIVIIAYDFKP